MKKINPLIYTLAASLLLPMTAWGETSGELSIVRQYDSSRRISRIDFVDEAGIVKTASDKG